MHSNSTMLTRPQDIILFTFATGKYLDSGGPSARNHICYARKHGYTYINEAAMPIVPSDVPITYNYIYLYRKYLSMSSWAMLLGLDSIIMNPEIKLESFLDDSYDMIITDHSTALNSIFLLRNSTWGRNFVEIWHEEAKFCNYEWAYTDNGAWWSAILRSLEGVNGTHYKNCRQQCKAAALNFCFTAALDKLAGPFLNRTTPHIKFLHPAKGFNSHFEYFSSWSPEDVFYNGMFLCHTKQFGNIIGARGKATCQDFEGKYTLAVSWDNPVILSHAIEIQFKQIAEHKKVPEEAVRKRLKQFFQTDKSKDVPYLIRFIESNHKIIIALKEQLGLPVTENEKITTVAHRMPDNCRITHNISDLDDIA
jgi:hypothetical protein